MLKKNAPTGKAQVPSWRAMIPKLLIEMEQEGDVELKRDGNGELMVQLTPKGEGRYGPWSGSAGSPTRATSAPGAPRPRRSCTRPGSPGPL